MKGEGAPRPRPITLPEPTGHATPAEQAAAAVRAWLIEPVSAGLRETYRALVTPEQRSAETPAAPPEPIVVFVWQAPERPPVAPPAGTERAPSPAAPPVRLHERLEQRRNQARIHEILHELTMIGQPQGQR